METRKKDRPKPTITRYLIVATKLIAAVASLLVAISTLVKH